MKYATVIMVLSALDIVVLYSGLPLGWKKGIIVVSSIILLFTGWILRAIYQRRKDRAAARARAIQESMAAEMDQVATTIARDVAGQVEQEIDRIQDRSY